MAIPYAQLLIPQSTLESIRNNFVAELQAAHEAKPSSIPFLRNRLPSLSPLEPDEQFQIMTIGGSVFKSAIVSNNGNGDYKIESQMQDTIPVFTNANVFFRFLEKHLAPVAYVGLNLAYPLQPVSEGNLLDGILIRGTKEHAFNGLIGKRIGAEFASYIKAQRGESIQVTVANDTVCLYLSQASKQTKKNTVAGIIGTGTNYAFALGDQVINLESGNFDKFTQTPTGARIDTQSLIPGTQRIEKEIAGAYLYRHFNMLVSDYGIKHPALTTTKSLSDIAEQEADEKVRDLARVILKRSAAFAATQIAGIVDFLSNSVGVPQNEPFIFVMEGTLFWDGYQYRTYLESYLDALKSRKILFLQSHHHSIEGGIKLLTGLS